MNLNRRHIADLLVLLGLGLLLFGLWVVLGLGPTCILGGVVLAGLGVVLARNAE